MNFKKVWVVNEFVFCFVKTQQKNNCRFNVPLELYCIWLYILFSYMKLEILVSNLLSPLGGGSGIPKRASIEKAWEIFIRLFEIQH